MSIRRRKNLVDINAAYIKLIEKKLQKDIMAISFRKIEGTFYLLVGISGYPLPYNIKKLQ